MGWVIAVVVVLVVVGVGLRMRKRRGLGVPDQGRSADAGYHDISHTEVQRNFDKFGGGQI